jgi:hypothetical protein
MEITKKNVMKRITKLIDAEELKVRQLETELAETKARISAYRAIFSEIAGDDVLTSDNRVSLAVGIRPTDAAVAFLRENKERAYSLDQIANHLNDVGVSLKGKGKGPLAVGLRRYKLLTGKYQYKEGD